MTKSDENTKQQVAGKPVKLADMAVAGSVVAAAPDAQVTTPVLASLVDVVDQSELVQERVEECVSELSTVNGVLKVDIAAKVPSEDIKAAISQNKEIEIKIQDCADELATINNVLKEEIHERRALDRELSVTAAALQESRAEAVAATQRALHDPLTGLPNATLFNDRLVLALSQAKRHNWKLAVMFIDLDRFKQINDQFGHDAGDQVLKSIATCLRELVRSGDSVGRRSGDEFLFLMLEARGEDTVAALARKIIDGIRDGCTIPAGAVRVRPSIGIALYPAHGTTPGDLLACADKAMYVAKQHPDGFAFHGQNPTA